MARPDASVIVPACDEADLSLRLRREGTVVYDPTCPVGRNGSTTRDCS
ncbi:hypothetical protein [Natrinema thermotolerans]